MLADTSFAEELLSLCSEQPSQLQLLALPFLIPHPSQTTLPGTKYQFDPPFRLSPGLKKAHNSQKCSCAQVHPSRQSSSSAVCLRNAGTACSQLWYPCSSFEVFSLLEAGLLQKCVFWDYCCSAKSASIMQGCICVSVSPSLSSGDLGSSSPDCSGELSPAHSDVQS
ncbi:hypothetical protein EK904_002026 [Melospiza melodia maxima]|nr:hypothetical protein EK904_002026 [Melospiza melodia maxima]